ncbi:hypothetical protein AB833_26395 [Chromatiales bacterium (ex Bugula neritina AB1)]|nr:hypothetical protein AB833_26395 [Chromatiales bacterium (ex Bugula neritina AB1)]
MNSEWQNFLTASGAVSAQNGQPGFESDVSEQVQDTVCDLSADVVLRITGDDAEKFLQGQFSNDIAALTDGTSQLSTWSSPKGRVITVFRIVRLAENHYLMQLPRELVAAVHKRLKMFVLMAKVIIELEENLICIGLSGNAVVTALETSLGPPPPELDGSAVHGEVVISRVRGAYPRFEVIAPVTDAIDLWSDMAGVARQSGQSVWRWQNIEAAVPSIGSETTEAFVLQMLNLQHINGVNFKKGCFPGQEVVARMQYLGKLKRRMYRASVSAESMLQAGDEIYNEGVSSSVGKVVDATGNGSGQMHLLAVLAIAAADKPLFADKEATCAIELLDLPYVLE